MTSRLLPCLTGLLVLCGCASPPQGQVTATSAESFTIPALDPGITLHIRNVRPAEEPQYGRSAIVLFVHGSAFPCEPNFDIDLPGGSWMAFMASRGFDANCVDIRGYGRSPRPASMEQPPEANPPFADAGEALRDVSAAVDVLLKRRGASTINLVGWSWG